MQSLVIYRKKHLRMRKNADSAASRQQRSKNLKKISPKCNDKNEERRVLDHLRRARFLHLEATLTVSEWFQILDAFGHRCALSYSFDITLDHFFPQSIGGPTSRLNVYPLDRNLNSSKQDHNPITWATYQKIEPALFEQLLIYFADLHNCELSDFQEYVHWCFREQTVDYSLWQQERQQKLDEQLSITYLAQQFNLTVPGFLQFVRFCSIHQMVVNQENLAKYLKRGGE